MERIFTEHTEQDPDNQWRMDAPMYLLNFYDDATSRLKERQLSPPARIILHNHCEMIKRGDSFLDPDDTVDMVLERLEDHHP